MFNSEITITYKGKKYDEFPSNEIISDMKEKAVFTISKMIKDKINKDLEPFKNEKGSIIVSIEGNTTKLDFKDCEADLIERIKLSLPYLTILPTL